MMHHREIGIASELLLLAGTAALTHYLVSFCQTLFHQHLGHRQLGRRLFRNHVCWHHVYYAKDHMVSETYLAEHGNNTPFFLVPTAMVMAAVWLLLPLDLFVAHVAAVTLSFSAHVYLDAQYHVAGSWLGRFGWSRRKQQLHFVHHRHANTNFAVIDFFWDRLLGTFRDVAARDVAAEGAGRLPGKAGLRRWSRHPVQAVRQGGVDIAAGLGALTQWLRQHYST